MLNGEPRGWMSAAHHFGWYTFDWCHVETCDDPTHFVNDGDDGLMEVAVEQSRLREAAKAQEWLDKQEKAR